MIVSMKDYCSKVNVFFGCDPVSLPKRKGIAKAWKPIKGMCGNTTPGAVLPFGKMSCNAYSGAYPTGYGNCRVNSHRPIKPMYPFHRFCGFTHVHPSGTGFIGYFYNFALVTPTLTPQKITEEEGTPGYYACVTEGGKYSCAVTADSAFHRFRFKDGKGDVYVDFSQYGLNKNLPNIHTDYDKASCRVIGDKAVCSASFYGVPVYYAVRAKNAESIVLFTEKNNDSGPINYSSYQGKFGVKFSFDSEGETVLSISFRSEEHALSLLERDGVKTFEEVKQEGYDLWNEMLSRIDVEGNEEDEKLFYSNLYFSLVKPSDVSGERLYGFDGAAVTDLATLWDMYKTEFPLLFTSYPEMGNKVIQTMISFYKKHGYLPNSYLISPKQSLEAGQAMFLTSYVFADAFLRGVGDEKEMYRVLRSEYLSDAYKPFRENGKEKRTTHTMDVYEGLVCLAMLAEKEGDKAFAEELKKQYDGISCIYSPKTGLLRKNSWYYEGNFINYSFRLHSSGDMRVKAAGGQDRFLRLLDYFFGYRYPWIGYGKFEGFNNETDMEAPYAYHFIGRHDRICEIVDASRKYMWRCTRGGMPGNNDTGALSSLYIWNALGLFPVTGQDRMIAGSPLFKRVTMKVGDRILEIVREGEGIYPTRMELNGVEKSNFECSVTEIMKGGKVVFHCEGKSHV